ncbi:MAG: CoA-acylating methylmalonate-semialdehyde dehydrogenase [Planctomycetota bacterium]
MATKRLRNYIGGEWVESDATSTHKVRNPATEELLAETPLCGASDIDAAVESAQQAFLSWRRVPPVERARILFQLKFLLEGKAEELAQTVTRENGKTLPEARGSVRRGIECVEVAAGAPSLLMGQVLEDVASGIDCESIRQPVGVFASISPFNFPAMVPLWFYPFAVVCGNTFVCKPSEQVPLSQQLIFQLIDQAGFPPGVLNLVHGGREAVESLVQHPQVSGISFVGSSPVASRVYKMGAERGKRVQALGGAKNFMVVMPDADMDHSLNAIVASAYGCAGERCLAGSVVLTVGGCHEQVRKGLAERVAGLRMGDGTEQQTTLGPLISQGHRDRVLSYVQKGVEEGAELVVDGRKADAPAQGYFLGPCLFDKVDPKMVIAQEEIFGPVLCMMSVKDLDEAMKLIELHPLANASSIFTTSGKHARDFKYQVPASMAGINVGVAAPMSFFGFGGAKGSFFGDLKAHGREAFDFYTDRKVVMSRWT